MTPKQQRFVEEYMVDLNATQAAIRAGYAAKDADVQGPRLLGNVGVRLEIERRRAAQAERAGLTVERVIKGLLREAELDGEGASHGARVSAWGHLGKHLGMFIDKQQIEGNININIGTGVPDGG